MMVTFVSQCQKNALKKTRRVLDAFADRIGDNTWQTVITEDGLAVVKKMLRQTASKNTAVACHWIRSRARSEFIWAVGNKGQFNDMGVVPVNSTKKELKTIESNWKYLPLIKVCAALAALLHDWGKASLCFQNKLAASKSLADPLRHEWISCLLLNAFIDGAETDEQWLHRLSEGKIDETALKQTLAKNSMQAPLSKLPPLASLVAWLIVSHHRLPTLPREESDAWRGEACESINQAIKRIKRVWGYENQHSEIQVADCLIFPQGLLTDSDLWLKQVKKWATKAIGEKELLDQSLVNGVWRVVLHHARLSLMLGDHWYSSQPAAHLCNSNLTIYANTDSKSKQLKQKLDEHLCGVAKQALHTAHYLPAFERDLPFARATKNLKQKSPKEFNWQDKIVTQIAHWRAAELSNKQDDHFGFFTVNMASTGCGKTFANAKIMRALSPDADELRYVLALGLRTLTLQTGDEYRERIGLDETDLAVLIGSRAVMDLHKANHGRLEEKITAEEFGSESAENLLDGEISYDCDVPEEGLATVLTTKKDRQFLYAPVLACTIDHMMAATETTRGGKYILPCLRLMSSDLVIDEIDDFDGCDLIAIARLVHLAGMLGRKVMISSATIPPDLAQGYFHAYQQGWRLFSSSRETPAKLGCAWVDEFGARVDTVATAAPEQGAASFYAFHQEFILKRVKNLSQQIVKRKAHITPIMLCTEAEMQSSQDVFFQTVQDEIIHKHRQHHQLDPNTLKKVSFGVVRVANIPPCVALTEFLMNAHWPVDIEVRVMAYHSQQVLLMRSIQEKHLDEVLKRHIPLKVFEHSLIKQQLFKATTKNVIYILVATPVEEVGRDHDFDWAVVEPSSFRSIIQLAGRVLRHRKIEPTEPNIALLQYNLKGFKQSGTKVKQAKAVFCRPGYESDSLILYSHRLNDLIDEQSIAERINAVPRISRPTDLDAHHRLADLEHQAIANALTQFKAKGPESLEGWLSQSWWLTALPQRFNRFRASRPSKILYLMPEDGSDPACKFIFMEKDQKGKLAKVEEMQRISHNAHTVAEDRVWLMRDYRNILQHTADIFGISVESAASRFGEISVPVNEDGSQKFTYSAQFGLTEIK
ncbi:MULTISPECIES: type I-F CRISPR-associated helicase Cas3f [unclassified Undibacterium]|uniref:type I-F CRISPR-associated helicase Cas3f n=1 Tax=unclassified Undibacterium TaxID=2630295 RepID=UPI002AC96EE7|nr:MULTISPECIES: type I-F CRISPR-associated helicase Cas3f [unclassified Undibacterium]MEB0139127.1 type I-F CRISPR-associated helicase Cas3f [Undibacterium sp. CCC2.1]MEB0172893.1 type I-F CRISPR-associated helicase Cas3f [Undibacterium sp. CCC1.1]MEB0176635.1 type I-F CRISPR-associated helicase Cas3f [Undibacterium sp. CCC3.4]MEB0216037.1 type I-F CRISPR-associated helicase Cas3f [Undibacterium sp. 5I2]WPX43122.1 type I-F CRISPR-associated helicase Cas3f [Undibacterium sp. CCC3.4]